MRKLDSAYSTATASSAGTPWASDERTIAADRSALYAASLHGLDLGASHESALIAESTLSILSISSHSARAHTLASAIATNIQAIDLALDLVELVE